VTSLQSSLDYIHCACDGKCIALKLARPVISLKPNTRLVPPFPAQLLTPFEREIISLIRPTDCL
jgi:hypothetical protein